MDLTQYNKIREQIDIVKVISNYVKLEKKGKEYVGLCPFHADKNPSMYVSSQKNIFKCFSCGASGDAFSFISKYENITYKEAVKKACELCNIEVPNFLKTPIRTKPHLKEYNAISKLCDFYQFMLFSSIGEKALRYLKNRGLTEDVIKKFKLGYAPIDSKASIKYLREKEKIDVETLTNAGILSSYKDFEDRNQNRIIFPISDLNSDIVGFSARKYDENDLSEAKYINSSESILFKKSNLLYNLNNAISEIKKQKIVYVLEGFMDVIACYRAGIFNAVGLMGTSLSKEHINFFKKYDLEVRLLLDADEPGQIGIQKAIYQLSENKVKNNVVIPYLDVKDTDEAIKKHGQNFVIESLNKLELPILFLLERTIQANQLNSFEQKQSFLESVCNIYNNSLDISKDYILDTLSSRLSIDNLSIKRIFEKNKQVYKTKVNTIQKSNNQQTIPLLSEKDCATKPKKEALVNYFKRYVFKNSSTPVLLKLLISELNIIVRIVKNIDFYNLFVKTGQSFMISQLDNAFYYISDTYLLLTNKVEYLRDEDFIKIIGDISLSLNEDNSTQVKNDKLHILNIMMILKSGKDVLVPCSDNEFKALLTIHLNILYKMELDKKNNYNDKTNATIVDKIIKNKL